MLNMRKPFDLSLYANESGSLCVVKLHFAFVYLDGGFFARAWSLHPSDSVVSFALPSFRISPRRLQDSLSLACVPGRTQPELLPSVPFFFLGPVHSLTVRSPLALQTSVSLSALSAAALICRQRAHSHALSHDYTNAQTGLSDSTDSRTQNTLAYSLRNYLDSKTREGDE